MEQLTLFFFAPNPTALLGHCTLKKWLNPKMGNVIKLRRRVETEKKHKIGNGAGIERFPRHKYVKQRARDGKQADKDLLKKL